MESHLGYSSMDRTLSALPKDQVHIPGTAVNVAAHLFCFALFLMSFLILCQFHIMYPNPIPLPIPPYLSSALAASPLTKTTQTNKQANLTMKAAVCHGVTHYTHPFLQIASSADVHRSESSLQYEVSRLWYTINTEPS